MLEVLLESPVTIGVVGAIVTIAALFTWLHTRVKGLLPLGIATAIATIILVTIGILFDTDKEILRRFVYETARELESNQYQKVLEKIHPQASVEMQEVRLRLPDIRFESARIKAIHAIDVKRHRSGLSATMKMNVFVEVEYGDRRGRAPRAAELTLEQVDGKWMIVDFQQFEPQYYLLNEQGRARLDSMRP
ncbi:MAG: hypothetical protein ACK553_07255 [Planctomycetota bacterium]|jgi:hypothetical protein